MSLRDYARKRRFDETPEPQDTPAARAGKRPIFVVQLHHASSRHYDFRLEMDGALKSWAVPKGPSLRPGEKRLAVEVEDHPLSYATFAGDIPRGHYGAGHVDVFDHGHWACSGDPLEGLAAGKLDFTLSGAKLQGAWKLVRTNMRGKQKQWLLMKRSDAHAADLDADALLEAQGVEVASSDGRGARVTKRGAVKKTATRKAAEGKVAAEKVATEGAAARKADTKQSAATKSAPKGVAGKQLPAKEIAAKEIATKKVVAGSSDAQRRTRVNPVRATPAAAAVADSTAKTPRKANASWRRRALALDRAADGGMPVGFGPQLATLRASPPSGDDWLHELKWDGYRLLVDLVDGAAKLRSRGGLAWNATFPEVVQAVEALPVSNACLDGELVVLGEGGQTDFAELQRVIGGTSTAPLRYIVFDLPGLAGVDLSDSALSGRKALLRDLLPTPPHLLAYSDHVTGHGREVFAQTGERGIEGVVSKRAGSRYREGRGGDWIKSKHEDRDEFVVVGFTVPKGARQGFGSLLMATRDDGALRYVGRVGTGFDDELLRTLHKTLCGMERKETTVDLPDHVPFPRGSVHWVAPTLVAEVAFRGWGKEGLLRQAAFKRLRIDKTADDVVAPTAGAGARRAAGATSPRARPASARPSGRTRAAAAGDTAAPTAHARISGRAATATSKAAAGAVPDRITHPGRVVFEGAKYTKGDVAAYYRAVAPWLLPELGGRPLSLLRCPDGTTGQCFFQKHHAASLGAAVRSVALEQKSGTEQYLYVDDVDGLLDLVQMNTLELHPWGSRVEAPESPDCMVFDLDPGEGVDWKAIVAAARDVRDKLKAAGLQSFVRLSGGKGLHVVVPIATGPSWDDVRGFCEGFAQAMAAHAPERYVATMSKAKRPGKIFIDWLRNARGATSVASWSLRARKGAPVAVPLRWEDLGAIRKPDAFDLASARERASRLRKDPWDGFAELGQQLPRWD